MSNPEKSAKTRSMQAAAALVILSAWFLIGVAAFVELVEKKGGSAMLMLGQGLLVTGFGLAILRALQTGFGALDRFFGAILQRTEKQTASSESSRTTLRDAAFDLAQAPAAMQTAQTDPRPAAQRMMAARAFDPAPQPVRQETRPVLPSRPLTAKAPLAQRPPAAKSEPALSRAPATKPLRTEKPAAKPAPTKQAAAKPSPTRANAAPAQLPPVTIPPSLTTQATPAYPIEEGFIADRAYRILSDGTVEVETLLGVRAFESLDVAREFIGAGRVRPNGAANEAYSSVAA